MLPPLGSSRTPNHAGRAEARQNFVASPLARRGDPHGPSPLGMATSLGRHPLLTAPFLARSALPPVGVRRVLLGSTWP